MTGTELQQFYEKLYFLELEARDKIHTRLQLSLTLLLAVGGAVVFLFQNFDYQTGTWTPLRVTFMLFFCGGIVILVIAAGLFVKAFYNPAYRFLPDSAETARYKARLEDIYKEYDERGQLVSDALDKYVTDYYIEYGAFNTRVNDRRATYLHSCNGAIIAAATILMLAYLAFYFGDLDKGRIKPATEVFITKPVDVRVQE
jgi:hypothetical protein